MKINSLRTQFRRLFHPFFGVLAVMLLSPLFLIGCGGRGANVETPPIVFPAPPQPARVQYLGTISSPRDLPPTRGAFASLVFGPEPIRYVPAKPINAILEGSKLYICDTVINTVFVYDLVTGENHPLRGDRRSGKIRQPNNIFVDDDGMIYIADKIRQAVLVYGPDESFITAFGRPGECAPVDVIGHGDELYVCDVTEHEIEVWNKSDGSFIRKFGGLGNGPGQFFIPTYIAIDDEGLIYVTDTGNHRVQKLTPQGEALKSFGGHGRSLGQFAWPKGLDVDGNERVYVADTRFANVQIFGPDGELLFFFGGPGPDRGNLDLPAGVFVTEWPTGIKWFETRLLDGFNPEYLVVVVNQEPTGFINFFAVAGEAGELAK